MGYFRAALGEGRLGAGAAGARLAGVGAGAVWPGAGLGDAGAGLLGPRPAVRGRFFSMMLLCFQFVSMTSTMDRTMKSDGQARRELLHEGGRSPGAEGGLGGCAAECGGQVPPLSGLQEDDPDEQKAIQDVDDPQQR